MTGNLYLALLLSGRSLGHLFPLRLPVLISDAAGTQPNPSYEAAGSLLCLMVQDGSLAYLITHSRPLDSSTVSGPTLKLETTP
jgi:hypothetical protein